MPRSPKSAPASPAAMEPIRFEGVLEANIMQFYHGIYVPFDVLDVYGTRSKVRVYASFNGQTVERALIPDGNGRHFLILGGDLRREIGLTLGERVAVSLTRDPRPDGEVEPCEELAAAIEFEDGAAEKYALLKPGQRRGLNYYITQGKRPETRAKRAVEVAHKVATSTLYGQRVKAAKERDN
jgi:hypothetical protein